MKTGLLIVDVQNDYFAGGRCELVNPLRALDNIEQALGFFRKSAQTIVHVQHINRHNTINYFFPDTHGAEIHARLTPVKDEYLVNKKDPNCFYQTGLKEILRGQGITHLVVCGMMTHMCIDTTVRAAADLGFACILARDACATRGLSFGGRSVTAQDVQTAYLAALHGTFAEVTDVKAVVSTLK